MRLLLALVCLGLLSTAGASRAAMLAGPDGFAICSFTFEHCEPLTDAAIARYGLSAAEKQIVLQLKRLPAATGSSVLDDLANAFGPRWSLDSPDYRPVWYPMRADVRRACFVCGLHLLYLKGELIQMSYSVRAVFTITWNRALMSPPAH
jgi:hypothetical protein